MKIWPSLLVFFFLFVTFPLWAVGPVIYGEDDRREIYESNEIWKSKASSVAVLVHRSKLKKSGEDVEISQKSFKSWLEELLNGNKDEEKVGVSSLKANFDAELGQLEDVLTFCPEERFTSQPVPGDCTGFLVAPDILLTAGHCASMENFCEQHDWIFDFHLDRKTKMAPSSLPVSEVYSCKKVIRQELNLSLGLDYALVQLDRKVMGREALEIEKASTFSRKTSLTVIGSPAGLPLKVSEKGKLRSTLHPFFFVSTLDTYKGNSGSPVFNSATGMVEGILVRGEDDFVPDRERMCLKSKRCEGNDCVGESVSKILSIPEISYLDILQDAVLNNDVDTLSSLKDLGVWMDMPNRNGVSALMQAMKFPHRETVELLIEGGADVGRMDKKGEASLHLLSPILSENTQDVLELLLQNGALLESRNEEGETPLLKAARWLNVAAVKILIESGADFEATNLKGEGVFHPFQMISDADSIAAILEVIREKTLAEHARID